MFLILHNSGATSRIPVYMDEDLRTNEKGSAL
jgi:hypothetical protein